jgi:hypothetical protein
MPLMGYQRLDRMSLLREQTSNLLAPLMEGREVRDPCGIALLFTLNTAHRRALGAEHIDEFVTL